MIDISDLTMEERLELYKALHREVMDDIDYLTYKEPKEIKEVTWQEEVDSAIVNQQRIEDKMAILDYRDELICCGVKAGMSLQDADRTANKLIQGKSISELSVLSPPERFALYGWRV